METTPIDELREWHDRRVNDFGEPYVTADELRELDGIIRRADEGWRRLERGSCHDMVGRHACPWQM